MERLIFIHGAGCTPSVFERQLAAFPEALAPALPGHGIAGSASSIGEFADVIAAALPQSGAVLAGSSMGGAIALELALRHDPRVHGVVLLGSSAKLRVSPAIFDMIADDFPKAARTLAGYFFEEPTQARIEAQVQQMLAVGEEQTRADFQACDAFDALERMAEIEVPLLALSGESDAMVPPKFSRAAADRVPRGEARIVPGAGHLLFIERPDETNEALRAFVQKLAS